MQEVLIEYSHAGTLLEGFLCRDENLPGPLPGVLIVHAWAGRSAFECNRARALAARGFAAFAVDLYGKGVLGSGPAENARLMQPFLDDRAYLGARLAAALAAFTAHPGVDARRIAAMGFCFGGLCVLDMARNGAKVQGVASFHGLLHPPPGAAVRGITARVLVLHGHEDPLCPVAAVNAFEAEMTAADADWQVHAYGGTVHSFTNPEARDRAAGSAYSESADRRSWQSLLNFLDEVIG